MALRGDETAHSPEDLAFEVAQSEAQRVLSLQAQQVSALRTRSITLTAVATAATAFVAGVVVDHIRNAGDGVNQLLLVLATADFVAIAVVSAILLRPSRGWKTHSSPAAIFKVGSRDVIGFQRQLVDGFEDAIVTNTRLLDRLSAGVSLHLVLTAFDLALWILLAWRVVPAS